MYPATVAGQIVMRTGCAEAEDSGRWSVQEFMLSSVNDRTASPLVGPGYCFSFCLAERCSVALSGI
jgi:hypothetical protein